MEQHSLQLILVGQSFEFDLKDNDRLEILLKGGTNGIDSVGM